MFGSAILDVAIGMIFVFLLLSLICSAINEAIEACLKNRAKDLERGISTLLSDPALADKFYNHALIQGLFQTNKGRPTYIPARTFCLALLNIIESDSGSDSTAGAPNALNSLRAKIEALGGAKPGDTKNPENPVAPIQQALLTLLDDAEGDIKKFRANIEGWYDTAMDRVSGWYKRRVQIVILFLGLAVAIGVNADSAYIARRLSNDPALRNTLVSAAEQSAKQGIGVNAGEDAGQKEISPSSGGTDAKTPMELAQKGFQDNLAQIKKLGLPIGWSVDGNDEHLNWPGLRVWQTKVMGAWLLQIRFH
ncbi:MAG TPA: hypothetical protein VGN86_19010, partial [Pyrinomonadaceae bacterium]|nr:hypothetical protein [Pyrinomonadaceae bacterium]